jgi:hypothetical protein
MAGTPRIYVDLLNTGGHANQVVLDTAGTLSDLERHGIVLREDLVLHLYSDDADESGQRDDLIVEGWFTSTSKMGDGSQSTTPPPSCTSPTSGTRSR